MDTWVLINESWYKFDSIYVGVKMSEAAPRYGLDVQVTMRECDTMGFMPLRCRIEPISDAHNHCYRRLTRNLEHNPAAAKTLFHNVHTSHLTKIIAVASIKTARAKEAMAKMPPTSQTASAS